MRVLLVHNRYRSGSPDGEEVVFRSECQLLREAGHEVATYTRSNDEFSEDSLIARVSIASQMYRSSRTRRELPDVIRSFDPDVVHIHNLFPLITPSAIEVCRSRGIPVVHTIHNFRLACMAGSFHRKPVGPCRDCVPGKPWDGIRRRCYRGSLAGSLSVGLSSALNWWSGIYRDGVQHFLVLTAFAQDQLVNFGVPKSKISVKPNFVDAPVGNIEGRRNVGVFSGRLAAEKGVDTLVAAWRHLKAVPLEVLGDGPDRMDLETQVFHHNLPIRFLGNLDRARALSCIRDARFLVATSDCFEGGVPLVVIEAWAACIPVITPDHGAFSDLLDGVEVLKFPRGDFAALARSVERLTSDDQLSRTLAQGGHQRYLRLHSPKASLETLESTYHAVAAAGVRR